MVLSRSSSSASPSKPVPTAQIQKQHVRTSLDAACCVQKSSSHARQVNAHQVILTPPALIPAAAIPQARKRSLARFLERCKERIIKASPYGFNKSSPDQSSVPFESLPVDEIISLRLSTGIIANCGKHG